jgi:hypothetical protein
MVSVKKDTELNMLIYKVFIFLAGSIMLCFSNWMLSQQ